MSPSRSCPALRGHDGVPPCRRPRRAATRWAAAGDAESEISWRDYSFPIDLTPDGRTLLFGVVTECSGAEPVSLATLLRALDGSAPVRVADGWADALSPDGRFTLTAAAKELRIAPTGAGESRVVTTDLPGVVAARWLHGGDGVLLMAQDGRGESPLPSTGSRERRGPSAAPRVGVVHV